MKKLVIRGLEGSEILLRCAQGNAQKTSTATKPKIWLKDSFERMFQGFVQKLLNYKNFLKALSAKSCNIAFRRYYNEIPKKSSNDSLKFFF